MRASHTLEPHRPPEFSQRCERVGSNGRPGCARNRISEAGKLAWTSARISYPPAINNAAGWSQNDPKKCQQKCQQNSSKVVQGPFSRSSAALYGNSPISVPKVRGEGRRFRPSPPTSFSSGFQGSTPAYWGQHPPCPTEIYTKAAKRKIRHHSTSSSIPRHKPRQNTPCYRRA